MKKMTCRSRTPSYTPYPHFLKDIPIGDTPRLVYAFLFGRAQMSQSHGWEDESGVYIYYPIAAIARDCGKCAMTVKTALNALEKADLIARKRMGVGRANKIYVHIPELFVELKSGIKPIKSEPLLNEILIISKIISVWQVAVRKTEKPCMQI